MGPLTAEEIAPLLRTEQVQQYATAVDRESAYEILGARITNGGANDNARAGAPEAKPAAPRPAAPSRTEAAWHEALRSPVARTIATQVTRGLMGALLGKPPPRRRSRRAAW